MFKQAGISERSSPSALPLNNSYQKQRIERRTERRFIFQPAMAGRNILQLCQMLVAEIDRKPLPVSRKQEKHPDGNSAAFPAVVGSN